MVKQCRRLSGKSWVDPSFKILILKSLVVWTGLFLFNCSDVIVPTIFVGTLFPDALHPLIPFCIYLNQTFISRIIPGAGISSVFGLIHIAALNRVVVAVQKWGELFSIILYRLLVFDRFFFTGRRSVRVFVPTKIVGTSVEYIKSLSRFSYTNPFTVLIYFTLTAKGTDRFTQSLSKCNENVVDGNPPICGKDLS